jgi:hypothetical protein
MVGRLHPRSICIGETIFLGPETERPKSHSGQKRAAPAVLRETPRQGPRSRPYLRRRRAGRAIFRGDCKAAGVPTFETPRWPFSQGGRSQPAGGINQSVMSAPTAISDSTAFAIMSAGQGMTFTDGAGGGGPG